MIAPNLSRSVLGLLQVPLILAAPAITTRSENATRVCSPEGIPTPSLSGAEVLSVSASEVYNYTATSVGPGSLNGGRVTIDFCNVTITHTHPGWNDTITNNIWLPLTGWNGRFQAVGGGGYSAGFGSLYLAYTVSKGFAAAETDAGHAEDPTGEALPTWTLASPGNLNLPLMEDWGYRSLSDMTLIAKSAISSYYGRPADYSYFNGCSGGGRQGMVLAQRYPSLYDGILAASPAMNIYRFIPADFWATVVMNELSYYPPSCEVSAFTDAAIDACDRLDGLEDGIISDPSVCNFTAASVVGQSFTCSTTGATLNLTGAGAAVVQAAWDGAPTTDGWYGVHPDADLSILAGTTCPTNSTSNCTAANSPLLTSWLKYFIFKDADYPVENLNKTTFLAALHSSTVEFTSSLGAEDADLTAFKAAGGKLITWHGIADTVIPIDGSAAYFDSVKALDKEVSDYFRFFEAPGVGHCVGGSGYLPNAAFASLVDWVEEGKAPDTLVGAQQAGTGNTGERKICQYPAKQIFVSGNGTAVDDFECL